MSIFMATHWMKRGAPARRMPTANTQAGNCPRVTAPTSCRLLCKRSGCEVKKAEHAVNGRARCHRSASKTEAGSCCRRAAQPGEIVIRRLLAVALGMSLAACLGYQPPSGRGYDYDRGRALARSDIGSDRLVYLLTGHEADRLAALRQRIEANCGFTVRRAYTGADPDKREVAFAQGYNSVSVPVIEQRLESSIGELMKRCANGAAGGN